MARASPDFVIKSTYLTNLNNSWFISLWMKNLFTLSNEISIFDQNCAVASDFVPNFRIYLNTSKYVAFSNSLTTQATTITPNGWTNLVFTTDGLNLSVISNLSTPQTLIIDSIWNKQCDILIGKLYSASGDGNNGFLLRELKFGFYPLNPNYANFIVNSAKSFYDTHIPYYFKLNSMNSSQMFYNEVSQSYLTLTSVTTSTSIQTGYLSNYLDSSSSFNNICSNMELFYPTSVNFFCSGKSID